LKRPIYERKTGGAKEDEKKWLAENRSRSSGGGSWRNII